MATEKRLIDANALMDTFCNTFYPDELRKTIYFGNDCHRIFSFFEKKSRELILNAPALDAMEVVHGRWEWLGPNSLIPECMCGTCSICKVRCKYIINTAICPICGAKMD